MTDADRCSQCDKRSAINSPQFFFFVEYGRGYQSRLNRFTPNSGVAHDKGLNSRDPRVVEMSGPVG